MSESYTFFTHTPNCFVEYFDKLSNDKRDCLWPSQNSVLVTKLKAFYFIFNIELQFECESES